MREQSIAADKPGYAKPEPPPRTSVRLAVLEMALNLGLAGNILFVLLPRFGHEMGARVLLIVALVLLFVFRAIQCLGSSFVRQVNSSVGQ